GDVDHLGRLEMPAVETGIDGTDTLVQGRMGGPQPGEAGAEALGEEEVADGGALVGLHPRAEGVSADFLQSAGEALRVPGELYGRGIREKLALPGYGGLDNPAEEVADVADDHQGQRDDDQDKDESV